MDFCNFFAIFTSSDIFLPPSIAEGGDQSEKKVRSVPVSYTHLDVYKRQFQYNVDFGKFQK